MGRLMRYASLLSPVRHYFDFDSQMLFKGTGVADVWPDIIGIFTPAWPCSLFRSVALRDSPPDLSPGGVALREGRPTWRAVDEARQCTMEIHAPGASSAEEHSTARGSAVAE
jgi:hypothetical protein